MRPQISARLRQHRRQPDMQKTDIWLDVRCGLPFANSVDSIYSTHMISIFIPTNRGDAFPTSSSAMGNTGRRLT